MRTSSCKGEVEIVESKGDTERCIIPACFCEIKCNKRNVETVDLLVNNLLAVGEKLFI
jgi:hypothetical protein